MNQTRIRMMNFEASRSRQSRCNTIVFLLVGTYLLLSLARAQAFALLGPFEPWMDRTNNLRMPRDIGGPMNLGAEYRWNVPTVTYGFDQSFRDYFGSNGVAAVEAAIAILNDLPRASQVVLSNFTLTPKQRNLQAERQGVVDMKSTALTLLLEEMGLAEPSRHVFDVRSYRGCSESGFGIIRICG